MKKCSALITICDGCPYLSGSSPECLLDHKEVIEMHIEKVTRHFSVYCPINSIHVRGKNLFTPIIATMTWEEPDNKVTIKTK